MFATFLFFLIAIDSHEILYLSFGLINMHSLAASE